MAIDLTKLSQDRLAGEIASHENNGKTAQQSYRDAKAEVNRRLASSFQFGRTVNLIRRAARGRKFTTLGDLASAYATDPVTLKDPLLAHLADIAREAHARRMPLVTSLVVEEPYRQTGQFTEPALARLVLSAREAGYVVKDARRFLQEQQQASFDWGSQRAED